MRLTKYASFPNFLLSLRFIVEFEIQKIVLIGRDRTSCGMHPTDQCSGIALLES